MKIVITLALIILLSSSCKRKLYVDQIDPEQFCKLFKVTTSAHTIKGKNVHMIYTDIVNITNNPISAFIQSHPQRFDYIISKVFTSIYEIDGNTDSVSIKKKFCEQISTDSFYHQFILLINGNRNKKKKSTVFSKNEMMMVASKFFYCNAVNEKDTTVSFRVCVGINGVSALSVSRDYTGLEAFCFEAIIKNTNPQAPVIKNFFRYTRVASTNNKKQFVNFSTFLETVKNDCFKIMETDEALQNLLLKYYASNKNNINFTIQ